MLTNCPANITFGIGLGLTMGIFMICAAIGCGLYELISPVTNQPQETTMSDNKRLIYSKGEVVGAFFLQAEAKNWAENVPTGTKIRIDREKDNPHDPHACRVIAIDGAGDEHPLGYIPGQIAPAIALFCDNAFIVSGEVVGRIGKRSMGNQPRNPAITLYVAK